MTFVNQSKNGNTIDYAPARIDVIVVRYRRKESYYTGCGCFPSLSSTETIWS